MTTSLSTVGPTATLAPDASTAVAPPGLRGRWPHLAAYLTRLVPHDALAFIDRIGIGAIFFLSGRTKVEGWLTVTDPLHPNSPTQKYRTMPEGLAVLDDDAETPTAMTQTGLEF